MSVGVVSSKPVIRQFDPRSIPRCALWYDAADASTITLSSGSNVGQWSNKANVIATLSQITGSNQPVYNSNLKAVQFDGSRQCFMRTPSNLSSYTLADTVIPFTSSVLNAQNLTIFSVVNVTQPGSATDLFRLNWIGGLTYFIARWQLLSAPSNFLMTAGPTPLNMSLAKMTYNTPTVLTMQVSGEVINRCYINGLLQTTTNQGSYSIAGTNRYILTLGDNTTGSNLSGNIHELLWYNNCLENSSRQEVENYLLWKWGIQSNVSNPITLYRAPPQQTLKDYYPILPQTPIAWLDAMDRSSISIDGSNKMVSWTSKYYPTISAVCTVSTIIGNAPVYSSLANGLPAFSFTTVSAQGMFLSLSPTVYNSRRSTNIMVMQIPSTGAYTFINTTGSNAAALRKIQRTNNTTLDATAQGGNTARRSISLNEYNVPIVVSVTETGGLTSAVYPNEGFNIYVNGVLTDFAGTSSPSNTTLSYVYFGGDFTLSTGNISATSFATCHLAEWLLFSPPLNIAQRQTIEGYLAAKWRITISSGNSLNGNGSGLASTVFLCPHPYYRRVGSEIPMLAPSLYSPDTFNNLVLWLDAADRSSISRDSNNLIVQWLDKSICGNHINVTTGTNPTLIETSSMGSLPALRSLSGTSLSAAPDTYNCVFLVNHYIANSGDQTSRFQTNREFLTTSQSSGNGRLIASNNGSFTYSNSNLPTLHTINTVSQFTYYVNGSLVGSNSPAIGSGSYTFFNGSAQLDYGEVIVYSGLSLTRWAQSQIEGYLAWKWGLRSYLPSNHPYYLKSP